MKKTFLVLAVLTSIYGCTTSTVLQTRDEVAGKVVEQVGYGSCSGCDKIKSYAAPKVLANKFFNDKGLGGWLNIKLQLAATNYNTPEHIEKYRVFANVTANGAFQFAWHQQDADGPGIKFWIVTDGGQYLPLDLVPNLKGERIANIQCFSNVGSGCSWDEYVDLPAKFVEDAYSKGEGLQLYAGVTRMDRVAGSDGYNPTASTAMVRLGEPIEFTNAYIGGFIDGLTRLNAEIPSSQREAAVEREIATADAARQAQASADELAKRPLKMTVGARLCQRDGIWLTVGYTEAISGPKIKIHVVQRVVASTPQLSAGGFQETTIWDYPENWSLCEN